MDPTASSSLLRSFERHLRAENRSGRTVATYLILARQAEAFLTGHGTTVAGASRSDLEAFLGDLLTRRAASTAATYHKVLKVLYRWLEEEEEITANPMAKLRPPITPSSPSRLSQTTASGGCSRPAPGSASRTAATPPCSCSCSTLARAGPSWPACD